MLPNAKHIIKNKTITKTRFQEHIAMLKTEYVQLWSTHYSTIKHGLDWRIIQKYYINFPCCCHVQQAIKKSMKPAQDWGPRLDKFRTGSRYGPLHPTFSDFNDNNQSRKPTSNCCCTTDVDVRTTDVDVRTTVHVRQRSQTHGIQPITVQNSNNIHVTHM